MKTNVLKKTKVLLKTMERVGKKHAPTFLAIAGCAGVVCTAVLVAKEKTKADNDIQQLEAKNALEAKETTNLEKIKTVAPTYAPAICVGLISIGCICGSNIINLKRIENLTAMYNISKAARDELTEYKEKIQEKVDPYVLNDINDDFHKSKEKIPTPKQESIIHTGHGDVLCQETTTGQFFYCSADYIRKTVTELNYKLSASYGDTWTLNDLIDKWGLNYSKLGDDFGWDSSCGQRIKLDLSESRVTKDGIPYLLVNINPNYLYEDRY